MKLLISIYFFILAIIQMGLFFGVYHYYKGQSSVRPNSYWMSSLLASIVGLLIFGVGIVTLTDIKNPEFNFTVANALFYTAAILQVLFCYSLNKEISLRLKILFAISLPVFLCVFEFMRLYANFELRTIFMGSLAAVLYAIQIAILGRKKKQAPSRQLMYLQYASFAELFFALCRVVVLTTTALPIVRVDQLPQTLIFFTIAQLVMNTLSYIAIGGYWAERIAVSNAKSELENQEIRVLLQEREKLISSLLKANKTAATGALSASIAHELNQPLGASSLNIQFLQKKINEGTITPELQAEILNTLLQDNQRAATIIRSLRSVFADEAGDLAKFDLGEIIDDILQITQPEIIARKIHIERSIESHLIMQTNRSEIQQVLLNLINNAIQALVSSQQSNKKIWIEGRFTPFGIEVSIADNGDGISTHAQSNLFQLLADSKKKGMGLGLWLCKHIVMRHGGTISFESHPGGGAKFVINLPLRSAIA